MKKDRLDFSNRSLGLVYFSWILVDHFEFSFLWFISNENTSCGDLFIYQFSSPIFEFSLGIIPGIVGGNFDCIEKRKAWDFERPIWIFVGILGSTIVSVGSSSIEW